MKEKNKKLKYYFDKKLAVFLSNKIIKIYPSFPKEKFIDIVSEDINDLELKQRIETFTDVLHEFLPHKYADSIKILLQILGKPNTNETGMFKKWYWVMPIAFFVEKYGIYDFKTSIEAIYQITQRNTGEFAVRPFLVQYPTEMLNTMLMWSKNENFHVRRLSSEGVRPRLPWAKKLKQFIEDPKPIIPILDNLKEDPSLFVKKSVANNLNDILKDNYTIGFKILKEWSKSNNKNTLWIVKHALRNEIKKDNYEAKKLIGR